jgi:hypothetical protein
VSTHNRRQDYSFRDLTLDDPATLDNEYVVFSAASNSTPGHRWHVTYCPATGESHCECRDRASDAQKSNCFHQKIVAQRYFYEYWTQQFSLGDGLALLRMAKGSIRLVLDKGLLEVGGEPWAAMEALTDVIDQRLLEWESVEQTA